MSGFSQIRNDETRAGFGLTLMSITRGYSKIAEWLHMSLFHLALGIG